MYVIVSNTVILYLLQLWDGDVCFIKESVSDKKAARRFSPVSESTTTVTSSTTSTTTEEEVLLFGFVSKVGYMILWML